MGASRCVGLAQGAFDNLALGPCFTLTMFLTVGAVGCGILLLACVATNKNPMNKPVSMPKTSCQNWLMIKCTSFLPDPVRAGFMFGRNYSQK